MKSFRGRLRTLKRAVVAGQEPVIKSTSKLDAHEDIKGYKKVITGLSAWLNVTYISEKKLELLSDNPEFGKVYTYLDGHGVFLYFEKLNRSARLGDKFAWELKPEELKAKAIDSLSKFSEQLSEYSEDDIDQQTDEVISIDTVKSIRKFIKGKVNARDEFYFVNKDGISTIFNEDLSFELKQNLGIKTDFEVSVFEINKLKGKFYKVDKTLKRLVDNDSNEINIELDDFREDGSKLAKDLPNKFTLDSKLKKAIEAVTKSADKGNPKPEINTIMFQVIDNTLNIVSTDTRRLAISSHDTNLAEMELLVPKAILSAVDMKTLTGFSFSDNDHLVKLEDKDYKISGKTMYGKFPEWKRIVPKEVNFTFELDTKEMLKILTKIKEKDAVFKFFNGQLEIVQYNYETDKEFNVRYFVNETTVAKIEVDSKEKLEIGVTLQYVKDAISNGSETFAFKVNEGNLPFIIESGNEKTIVMPFLIGEVLSREQAIAKYHDEKEEKQKEHDAREAKKYQEEQDVKAEQFKKDGVAGKYLDSLPPRESGKARKILSKQFRYKEGTKARKDWIADLAEKKYIFTEDKDGYNAESNDGSGYYYDILKTEYEFAKYYEEQKADEDEAESKREIKNA